MPKAAPKKAASSSKLVAKDIKAASVVIDAAIKGLQAVEDSLDGTFSDVVNLIVKLKGRVVISGMGKSGHVARKIAATLASTGTPAMFVHPGEASHGDLGMITQDDAVILLSNSGETSELQDITNYTQRFSIPLIAIVRRRNSTLVEAATHAFVLPAVPEASPTGAPTTSTTMMLVLGDALAMALLERRGFGVEDFQVFHPGGKLGSRFVRVEKLMKKGADLPIVSPKTVMSEVLITMTKKSLGCAVVVDASKKILGIVTDGDLRRHMQKNLLAQKAAEVMTGNPISIRPHALVTEALATMNARNITSLCVAEDGKLHGIIHIQDILRAGVS